MHRSAGFTLIECTIVCAVVAVFAAVALPSFQGSQLRMARIEAMSALTRVQAAQEQYRSLHGLYAADLGLLKGVQPTTPEGHYTLRLEQTGPEAYRASAVAQGRQQADKPCPALTLDVNTGFARNGPDAACWNR